MNTDSAKPEIVQLRERIASLEAELAEQERSIESLREQGSRLRAFVQAMPDLGFILDEQGTYLEVLTPDETRLVIQVGDLIGKTLHEVLPATVADDALATIRATLASGKSQILEYELEVPVGPRWFEGHTACLTRESDGRGRIIWLSRDVTERKRTEEALRDSQAQLLAAIETWPFDFWVVDTDGRYLLVNSALKRNWGVDPTGRHPRELAIDEDILHVWIDNNTRALSGELVEGEVEYNRNGERKVFYNIIAPIRQGSVIQGSTGINIDITYFKKWTEESQRIQKLESIELMAGGIAHDFNNILTVITGGITMARLASENQQVTRYLDFAEKAAQQAKNLTTRLLSFTRGEKPDKKIILPAAFLEETVGFALTGSPVVADYVLPPDLYPIEVDTTQFCQVISNLVINAVQSMPGGGRVTVRAANIPEAKTRRHPELPDNHPAFLEISISDNGTGIPEEHLTRIFDPYFTTKGQGTGLGLTVAYSIVRNHNGHLKVDSQVSEGTTFRILLPATSRRTEAPSRQPERHHNTGRGRILVMDDDSMVSMILKTFLQQLGYSADVSHNGEQAVELFRSARSSPTPYDAVILDLTVPGNMGGLDCLEELRKMDAHIRAILTSGYSNEPVLANHRQYGFQGMLAKPFSLEGLGLLLDEVVMSTV